MHNQSINQSNKQRENYQFRILYALGIVFVVAGHCGNGGISIFYDWFTPYAFHLGIFAFGSGFFYKMKEADNQIKYIYKKIKNLVVPVLLCNILYGVIVWLLRYDNFTMGGDITLYNLFIAPINSGHQFVYNLGTWFVAPLFMILVINNLLFKLIKNVKFNKIILVFVLYFVLGVIGVALARNGYNKGLFLVLDRMLFFMPMFGLGILYNKYRFFDNIKSLKYFCIIFIFQLAIIHINGGLKGNNAAWMIHLSPGIKPFIIEFIGIFFWLRVAKILEPILKDNQLINYIGNNTFSIMTHHLIAFMFVKFIFRTLSKFTPFFSDFNVTLYKASVWYIYLPNNINQYKIIYLIAGILIPLGLSYGKDFLVKKIRQRFI